MGTIDMSSDAAGTGLATGGELRKDPTTGKWVLARPRRLAQLSGVSAAGAACPFCPGYEHVTPPEIVAYRAPGTAPNGTGWQVRVFPDRDPYFRIEEELVREGVGMFDRISTRGASEIVVEAPSHAWTLAEADPGQIEQVLWMYRDRIQDLKRDPKIRSVVVTRTYGKAGARVLHPYSRVLAAPIVLDDLRAELTQAREYFGYKRRCLSCDTMRQELATGTRMIVDTDHFAAFVPYAARVPFELRVLPRRHRACYQDVSVDEVTDLARVLRTLCDLLARRLGDPPFDLVLHTAPNLSVRIVQDEWDTLERDYHWHLELLPNPERRTLVAGIAVTDMLPEEAAEVLGQPAPDSLPLIAG